jgi:hypothetical protein
MEFLMPVERAFTALTVLLAMLFKAIRMPAARTLTVPLAMFLVVSVLATPSKTSAQNYKTSATHLFWHRETDNRIARATIDGTEVNADLVSVVNPGTNGGSISVSGDYLYWSSVPAEGSWAIGRSTVSGADVQPALLTGSGYIASVLATPQYIYWSGWGDKIGRANADGSNPNPNFITEIYEAEEMTTDGTYLYWIDGAKAIGRSKLDGSEVNHAFISLSVDPYGIAATPSHIYWGEYYSDSIGRANLDGTEKTEGFIDTGAGSAPWGLVAGDQYVYWANDGNSAAIGRANLDGTDVTLAFISGTVADAHVGISLGSIEDVPSTDRDGSLWTTALVILAGLTAAASIGLRVRGANRA